MAWWKEQKRRQWFCVIGTDMIYWYRKKLYAEWYTSLTDEEKDKLEEYKRRKKEKEKEESARILRGILTIYGTVLDMALRSSR